MEKTLKEFKKEIKKLGYRVRTHLHRGWDVNFTCLEVLDQNKDFVVGSGANVYHKDTIDANRKVFDLLISNRDRVMDDSYDPSIKVKF